MITSLLAAAGTMILFIIMLKLLLCVLPFLMGMAVLFVALWLVVKLIRHKRAT